MRAKSLSIGNICLRNRVFLAPLAGITDFPFRQTARMFGAELTFTEMISANGIVFNNQKTLSMLKTVSKETPIAVQIFGSDPELMSEAAVVCEDLGASIIDINMGCPQKKIVKTGAGAALMKKAEIATAIVKNVVKKVSVPVSCKIRLGWDSDNINVVRFSKQMEDAGASMITVHGRTRAQMFSGSARWDIIQQVKAALSIPVIANGDISSVKEAKKCLQISGADGVMIGRAAIGKPWLIDIVSKGLELEDNKKHIEIPPLHRVVAYHLDKIQKFYHEKMHVQTARKHLAWYSKGMRNSSAFRNQIFRTDDMKTLKAIAKDFFTHEHEERRYN